EAGYDGEYGVIRLFRPGELESAGALFEVPAPLPRPASPATASPAPDSPGQPGQPGPPAGPVGAGPDGTAARHRPPGKDAGARGHGAGQSVQEKGASRAADLLAGLDPDQRAAAMAAAPLMIIAGPGTGKTRTLTRRIAAAVAQRQVPAEGCLALTFTRRAAGEMRDRLAALLGRRAARLTVTTFHGLGLAILREQPGRAGLPARFGVADEQAALAVATELAGSPRDGRALLAEAAASADCRRDLRKALAIRGLVDFDGLVELPGELLVGDPALAARLRERWPQISVDEYQDIDAAQYALLALLAGEGAGLTVIGDPDQAIYGFRGADVQFFLRFAADFPAAGTAR